MSEKSFKEFALEIQDVVNDIESEVHKDVAREVLKRTMKLVPRPPENEYATGRLAHSGAVYVGSQLVATSGHEPEPKHYDVDEPDDTITIVYSTPKKARWRAVKFYTQDGNKWFDYAPYQHMHNKIRNLYVDKVVLNEVVLNDIINNAVNKVFK